MADKIAVISVTTEYGHRSRPATWRAWEPQDEIIILPGDRLDERIDRTVGRMNQFATCRFAVIDIDGHLYVTMGSGKKMVPFDMNSPHREPLP